MNQVLTPVEEKQYLKLLPWLTHQTSLTERLLQKAGEATLHKLAQQWIPTCAFNQQRFDEPTSRLWCREILMTAHHQNCWYARSVYPEKTYCQHPEFFAWLERLSLGALIFKSAPEIQQISTLDVKRHALTHYSISPDAVEYQWLPEAIKHSVDGALWLRFSTLTINTVSPFYLVEIVLPDLLRYCE